MVYVRAFRFSLLEVQRCANLTPYATSQVACILIVFVVEQVVALYVCTEFVCYLAAYARKKVVLVRDSFNSLALCISGIVVTQLQCDEFYLVDMVNSTLCYDVGCELRFHDKQVLVIA